MPSAAGSIPPLAPSYPPLALVVRPVPHPVHVDAALQLRAVSHAASYATSHEATAAIALTAIAFRPDGRRALTLRIDALHCVTVALLLIGSLGAALAAGWMLGTWTALL